MTSNSTPIGVNRRQVLKALGGTVAASFASAPTTLWGEAASCELREKAKKNLKIGIFQSVYSSLPLDEAARRIKEDGFKSIVFEGHFKDVQFNPLAPDWNVLKKMLATFERNDIEVAGLYGYYNVIDPDLNRRKQGEDRIHILIENWKRFGCPIISLETGSFHPHSQFADHPKNFTEEGYEIFKTTFEKLVRAAEKTGAILAVETYWRNVICSVERTVRLFRDIPSPSLKLTMDPCNYFRKEDLPRMQPMLEEMFRAVGKDTVLAHAKDVKASKDGTDLPAAGLGVLDYPLYLRLLAALDRPCSLVIEHLTLQDVPRARDYVLKQMEKI